MKLTDAHVLEAVRAGKVRHLRFRAGNRARSYLDDGTLFGATVTKQVARLFAAGLVRYPRRDELGNRVVATGRPPIAR